MDTSRSHGSIIDLTRYHGSNTNPSWTHRGTWIHHGSISVPSIYHGPVAVPWSHHGPITVPWISHNPLEYHGSVMEPSQYHGSNVGLSSTHRGTIDLSWIHHGHWFIKDPSCIHQELIAVYGTPMGLWWIHVPWYHGSTMNPSQYQGFIVPWIHLGPITIS